MFNLLQTLEEYGDRTALKNLDGDRSFQVSFSEYAREIRFCAYNLEQTIGNLKGRHIGLLCESNYEYTVLLAALMFSRAVVVPINTLENSENINHIITNSELEALILEDDFKDKITAEVKQYSKSEFIEPKEQELQLSDFTDDEADNPILIIYTSGTTSLSKGVVLSVGNQFGNKKSVINSDYLGGPESLIGMRIYSNFPFYHVAGITAWLACLECCCSLYLSANPKNILFDLEGETVDVGVVTPAVLKLWKKAINRGNLSRLGGVKIVASAGAKIELETIGPFLQQHILFCQFYGMTETGGNVTCNFDIHRHLESVGRPVEGVELTIQDGEICIGGSQIMQGYYNNPEETEACLIDGVIHTGDLGYIDEEGYVYITGRKKNLIILSSGENVSPEELEKMLYKCDSVVECKVYESIDRIIAGVFAPEEQHEAIREYVAQLNQELPIFKRIHKVEFIDEEFEKTASGKIKR